MQAQSALVTNYFFSVKIKVPALRGILSIRYFCTAFFEPVKHFYT